MSNLVGNGNPSLRPQRPSLPAHAPAHSRRPDPQATAPQRRPDGLALSAAATALSSGEASQAIAWLKRLSERPGGMLRDAEGAPLTPLQALDRLANGLEVLARVSPEGGQTRSASALLFSIEDIRPMAARLAQAR